jgi:hypothetical protein
MQSFGIGRFGGVVHDKSAAMVYHLRRPELACAPAVFLGVEALLSLAPVDEIVAVPYIESFGAAGGIAVVRAFVQENLGITDFRDVGNNHIVSPLQ